MSVTIKRKTGTLGMGARFSVKVNGEKVTKISHQETIELDIKGDNSLLRVSQFGAKSNQVEVKDGDVVEVTTTKLAYIAIFIPFIFIIASRVMESFHYTTSTVAIMLLLMLFVLFTFNNYRLKIIDHKAINQPL
ncbi:hypothetical protein JTF06_02915 [Desemzia sp. RIT804]|uniref:hypothetical protein n=1 Tax=Desemzia sp. RIT 804 TaxID=2810209 RepID=UPI001951EA83|nr:hypothetical protein [Desemzia sp. RIT 804]MBM6613845.1 hypothetical protein [Desemzia sp. RIT 804]